MAVRLKDYDLSFEALRTHYDLSFEALRTTQQIVLIRNGGTFTYHQTCSLSP